MNKFNLIQKIRNKIKIKGNNDIQISKNAKIVKCNIYIKGNNNKLEIGNSILRNVKIEIIGDNNQLIIKDDCMIGDNCYLVIKEGTKIIINNNVGFSRNIKLMTSDGHPIFDKNTNQRINIAKDIIINEKVWIADNVTILKGVKIGSNSVIGINSTLTKSIPNNTIAAGNPATIIKENIYWEDKL